MSRPLAVFAYDFDGTLARGNMQEHAFIPDELGMDHADFWRETQALAQAQRGDGILAYMHLMLEKAREKGLELTLDSWRNRGAALRLFPGVEDWFERVRGRPTFHPAFVEWLPAELAAEMRSNGERSWPAVAALLGIDVV